MNGLVLAISENKKNILVKFEPLLIERPIEPLGLMQEIAKSEFANYFIFDDELIRACDKLKEALDSNEMEPIEHLIATQKDAEIEISIAADKMSAEISITAPYMGKIPSVDKVIDILGHHDVKRGISKKRIRTLLQNTSDAKPGAQFSDTIAKGLPPRQGKNSFIKPAIPNALERALFPKDTGTDKVDMRDFGDILCIEENQIVAQRMPPTNGRKGFTVTNKTLDSEPGKWIKIKLGKNVCIDPTNENNVLSTISGLPKANNSEISVDNVFTSKGVNVATGNIKFDGSVIVNGDVTEKMRVVAKGDITINGFVESAYIEAGGDIIIMQGASGKMQNIDCEIVANGSIFIQHGQGLNITTQTDLNIAKQLAYSKVFCKGNCTIGDIKNPQGKLFASTLSCGQAIIAGHIGAISGSALNIDFSETFNSLVDKYEAMTKHFEDLSSKNADHEIKIAGINNRRPSKEYDERMALLNKELELERVFLNWMRINCNELKEQIDDFYVNAKLIARNKLFPGVSIKLNKKTWDAKKEYARFRVILEDKDWVYVPDIS